MKKLVYFTLFFVLLLFSFWLMRHTLSYDPSASDILVGGKYWSDFGGHLPQIRSFSKGLNWPPEYPLFPGEPIRYHFLFYALVGLLEKSGMRLDWALNIPSALGFFALILMIFALAKRLFSRSSTAVLSVIFFLFNASFSWLEYLKSRNFSILDSVSNLKSLSSFPSFAPWNSSPIAAFWNLNVYTNQRHLGLSFALALAVIYILYTGGRRLYLVGLLLGVLLLINQAAFAVAGLFTLSFFIFRPPLRLRLLLSSLGGLPFTVFSLLFTHTVPHIVFKPGFLLSGPLTPVSFFTYWLQNIGLHLALIPIALFVAPRKTRILILPLLILFIAPNLWQFSMDLVNNHKFFNFFLIIGSMFTAHLLVRFKPLLVLIPLLVLGGLIDFFPVLNDHYYTLSDYPKNPDIKFFIESTPPDAVILNSTWFYHPASLAGRKIFNGYSYFTWSFGYDQVAREHQALAIYRAPDKSTACRLLRQYRINYVELNPHPEEFIKPNITLWHNQFVPIYTNPSSGLSVYSTDQICHES